MNQHLQGSGLNRKTCLPHMFFIKNDNMPSWLRFIVFFFQKGGSVPSTKLQGKVRVLFGSFLRRVLWWRRIAFVMAVSWSHGVDPSEMIQCEGCIFFKGGWWTFTTNIAKNMVLSAGDLETPRLLTERSLLFGGPILETYCSLEGEICGSWRKF